MYIYFKSYFEYNSRVLPQLYGFYCKNKAEMLPVCSDEASVTDTALKLYSLLSFQEL